MLQDCSSAAFVGKQVSDARGKGEHGNKENTRGAHRQGGKAGIEFRPTWRENGRRENALGFRLFQSIVKGPSMEY